MTKSCHKEPSTFFVKYIFESKCFGQEKHKTTYKVTFNKKPREFNQVNIAQWSIFVLDTEFTLRAQWTFWSGFRIDFCVD